MYHQATVYPSRKWLTDNVSHLWPYLLIFIWSASLMDFFLTLFQVQYGINELNPILAPFFHNHLYFQAFLVKMSLTSIGVYVLSVCHRHPSTKVAAYFLSLVYLFIVGYHALNISQI